MYWGNLDLSKDEFLQLIEEMAWYIGEYGVVSDYE
jgi:hypothetical protein